MGVIYQLRNKQNGKCYVGQTRQKVAKRWYQHRTSLPSNESYIANAIRAHGWESFEPSIVCEIPNEELDAREILEIRERNTIAPNGYNLASGGGTNRVVHPETREKMSKAMMGKHHTEEVKTRIGAAHKGELSHNYGLVYTEQQRRNLAEIARAIGTEHLNIKQEDRYVKKVNQYTLEGVFVQTHESSVKAAESINVSKSTMSSCCLGKSQTSGGYIWQYADDNYVISQYTLDGKLVKSFKTTRNAAISTGSSILGVYACIKGKSNTSNGFIWKRELKTAEVL
jgi:group I intron endonuclease